MTAPTALLVFQYTEVQLVPLHHVVGNASNRTEPVRVYACVWRGDEFPVMTNSKSGLSY